MNWPTPLAVEVSCPCHGRWRMDAIMRVEVYTRMLELQASDWLITALFQSEINLAPVCEFWHGKRLLISHRYPGQPTFTRSLPVPNL